MYFSVRLKYPQENCDIWKEIIQPYKDLGIVEVGFLRADSFLKNVVLDELIKPIFENNLRVASIHFAQFNLAKKELFQEVFFKTKEIMQALNCALLIIHPSFGKLEDVKDFIEKTINPVLEQRRNLSLLGDF